MKRTSPKAANIAVAAVLAAGAAMYVTREGNGPPRNRTPVDVPHAATNVAPPQKKSAAAPAVTRPHASAGLTSEPALTIAELDQRLTDSEPGARDALLRATLPAMVAINPEETARFAELQTDPQLRELLVRQVAQLWSKTDIERAMTWLRSLPDSPERVATLIDVSLSVAQTDPARAIALREPDVGNIEPDGVLEALVQQWAEKDFDAALSWTNARPQNAQRDQLLQRLVYVRAANGTLNTADPAAANAWLEANGHRSTPDQAR